MKFLHVLAFIGCLTLVGCHSLNQYLGLSDDHAMEQISEEVIETVIQYETGFRPEIDLTP